VIFFFAGSVAHAASYLKVQGVLSPRVKRTTHLQLVPRLRMRGVKPPLLQYFSMVWCLIKQWIYLHAWYFVTHRDKFTLQLSCFKASIRTYITLQRVRKHFNLYLLQYSYLLTPWYRIFFEKLIVTQFVTQ
jgi:hypothetical protein